MQKYLIINMVYDTETLEKILSYDLGKEESVTLYRTKDSEWFYCAVNRKKRATANIIGKKYVRQILLNRNRQDFVHMYNLVETI